MAITVNGPGPAITDSYLVGARTEAFSMHESNHDVVNRKELLGAARYVTIDHGCKGLVDTTVMWCRSGSYLHGSPVTTVCDLSDNKSAHGLAT